MRKICYPNSTSNSGGSNNSAILIADEIRKTGKYETVLIFPGEGPIIEKVVKKDLKFDYIPLRGDRNHIKKGILGKWIYLMKNYSYVFRLVNYIKTNEINLVHTNDLMGTLFWGVAGKVCGIPVIWHVRQEKSSYVLDKIRLKLADRLIFISNINTRKFDKKTLNSIKYNIVYNGVDFNEFNSLGMGQLKNELKIDESTVLIGYVGYFVERKRPELFIQTAIEVIRKERNVHFILAGNDPNNSGYESKLKDIVKSKNVEDYFTFLGYRSDIPNIMKSLDIFVLTSTFNGEAFPRVILEAMACFTPVVSTDSAGVPEEIENGINGFVVKADDEKGLVEKILYLVDNKKTRIEFAKNGVSRVKKMFDNKKITKEIAGIYDSIFKS